MKKNKKKVLSGILIGMSCLLATGLVLQVTNVVDFTKISDEKKEANKNNSSDDEVLDTTNYLGTAVPTTGSIEKIYINTNLSKSRVTEVLDHCFFSEYNGVGHYHVAHYYEFENSREIHIIETNDMYRISIADGKNNIIIFDEANGGWTVNAVDEYEFNKENFIEKPTYGGIESTCGGNNEALSSLFSITPFVVQNS